MKSLKKHLTIASTLIAVIVLLSWSLFDDYRTPYPLSKRDSLKDATTIDFSTDDTDQPPAAEDILVQRIRGDNGHLLLMAYYSKENYSEPSVTINNGFTIVLRDDGKGDDKIAGDGLYTAKISADIAGFRNQAISLMQKMKPGTYKPIRYLNRQRIVDPDALETFELAKFDANEPVSVSGLTNALSSDFKPETTTQTSDSVRATVSGTEAASASLTAEAALAATPTTLDSISKSCIIITSLRVVEDSTRTWNSCAQKGKVNGPWTFGTLMRQMASKSPSQIATDAQLSNFVKSWLNTWANTHVINGDNVAARTLVNSIILNPWLNKSQNAGSPSGQLDMRFAPFKLTAIMNRFDLRDGQAFAGSGKPCGESRFVFCLIKSDCSRPMQFTVIFEYRINQPNTCDAQHVWAQQWVNLKNFRLGGRRYNIALQNITDQFTLCGTNTAKLNQSSISQVRTNEVALSPTPKVWELREFVLDSTRVNGNLSINLKETTVKQNPADKYNAQVVNADVQRMVDYVTQNKRSINAGTYAVPLSWEGPSYLGGTSHVNGSPTGTPPKAFHWDGTSSSNASTFISSNNARFNFSLQTCSGCHGGESQTAFTHIDPAFFGATAGLSGFLSGKAGIGGAIDFDKDSTNGVMSVEDAALRPFNSPAIRTFNDIDRRARDLQSFANTTCGTVLAISSQLMFQPTTMVH